ncbi:MAG: hypothetical protein IT222_08365 [Crocinitomix sp.]|nr:hypothetical protein [Crocinitomix sp.]
MLKIKSAVFFVVVICGVHGTMAQKGTQSPYSSFGLGELGSDVYTRFASMGNVFLANTDMDVVNTGNPASYPYMSAHLPILQIGLNGRFSNFSTSTTQTNQRHFGINQIQLGIPLKKNWGMAFGFKPYSFTGYRITKYTVNDEDTTQLYVNEGSGGIRIANFGIGYRPLNLTKPGIVTIRVEPKDTTQRKKDKLPISGTDYKRFSIGVNGNYLFGSSQQIRSAEFIPSTSSIFNSRVVDGLRVSGLSAEIGANFQFGFTSGDLVRTFSVGATYSPGANVRAFQDIYSFSYIGSFYQGQSVAVLDTIQLIQDNQGSFYKPEAFGVGFEYRFKPYKSSGMLSIGLDGRVEKWSTFSTTFSGEETLGGLKDKMSLGLGFQWTPITEGFLPTTPIFSKLTYRLGFNYSQTELQVKNNLGIDTPIDNYGMSFGIGLPINKGKSNTNINFGGNIGSLGTTENGLIKEQYLGFFIGLSLTPDNSNKWFIKRKYN